MDLIIPKNIKFEINSIIKDNIDNIDNIEIEIRVRDKIKNIKNLEEKLLLDNYILEKSESIDYYYDRNKIRITYKDGLYFETSKTHLLTKFYNDKHDLKLSINIEKSNQIENIPKKSTSMVRKKDRKSYIKDNFSIDITKIITIINEKETESDELEIEVIKANSFNFDKFNELIHYIFDIEDDDIIEDFTFSLGRRENNLNNSFNYFSKARDLEYADLTNDGILNPFTISIKANGENAFLYFHKTGIYFIFINSKRIEKISILPKGKEDLINSLFIGELILKKDLKVNIEEKYLYLPYDCLRYNDIDTRRLNYLDRIDKCKNIYNNLKDILIEQKPIIIYSKNTNELNNGIIESYKNIEKVKYYNDGLIFTPINSPYITAGQINNKNRILNKYLDVCKYKIPDDLTIDLKVKKDGVYTGEGKFLGTDKYPIKPWSFELKDEYIDKIIEFKPYIIDENKLVYKFFKDRTKEREHPNGKITATKLWKLRNDPIELKTLEGKDNVLMRRYHSQVKRRIINDLKGYVIDIGSGKGGDLDKYIKNDNIKEVLFIEPNSEFIEEFKNRLNKKRNELKGKEYKIIKSGGEETDKIINTIKNYNFNDYNEDWNINMMISLSFFWKDKEMLNSLAITIKSIRELYYKNGGKGEVYFNFLTIEGTRLEKLFNERGKRIILNDVELRKINDNEVFVNITDSQTVSDQTEYFVYLDQLWDLINFIPINLEEANGNVKGDFILSDNEKSYSSLFVYGSFKYYNKDLIYECLPVDVKKIDNKIISYGDDIKVKIENKLGLDNLYRVATLKIDSSFFHSILKILNISYREADVKNRILMVRKIKDILDIKTLKYGIKIISEKGIEIINEDKDNYIILFQCNNGEYEPIIRMKKDKIDYLFKKK